MYYEEEQWVTIDERIDPEVKPCRYHISSHGRIKSIFDIYTPIYNSTNGFDYAMLECSGEKLKLFKLDLLVVKSFGKLSKTLSDKHLTVVHINDDTRDNHFANLLVKETTEEWVDLCEDRVKSNTYQISNLGRIRNINHNRILKYQDIFGYSYVSLLKPNSNRSTTLRVHRLVAKYFVPNPFCYDEVNHINGMKKCNVFDNLEWVNRSMNQKHAFDTCLQGELISTDELDDIRDIVFYGNDNDFETIHQKYPNVKTPGMLSRILHGESIYARSYKYNLSSLEIGKFLKT